MTFGKTIKAYRKGLGYTIQQMAPELGCSTGYLSEAEQDKVPNPSEQFIRKVADRYSADPDALRRLLPSGEDGSGKGKGAEVDPDRRHIDIEAVRGSSPRDLQFLDAQLKLLRAYQSGNDLTDTAKVLSSRLSTQSERWEQYERPERIDRLYVQLAEHYMQIGFEICWPDASDEILIPRLKDALAFFKLAEDICIRLQSNVRAQDVLIRVWYRQARALEDLAKLDLVAPTESLFHANEGVERTFLISSAIRKKFECDPQSLSNTEKALWPASLALSAFLYVKIIAADERTKAENIPGDFFGIAKRLEDADNVLAQTATQTRRTLLENTITDRRTQATKLYKRWIRELRRRCQNREEEAADLLATANFRLAMLKSAVAISKATPDLKADLKWPEFYFEQALNLRRELARQETDREGPHHRDLARYHRELGLILQYSKSSGVYADMMWQYHVAGKIYQAFSWQTNRKMQYLQSLAEAATEDDQGGNGLGRADADRKIQAMLAKSDFTKLDYELLYADGQPGEKTYQRAIIKQRIAGHLKHIRNP